MMYPNYDIIPFSNGGGEQPPVYPEYGDYIEEPPAHLIG